MTRCLFASDLHGDVGRYEKLWRIVVEERPAALFLGGDLLPGPVRELLASGPSAGAFVTEVLAAGFERLRSRLGVAYPRVFLILGNDDGRIHEPVVLEIAGRQLWDYVHGRRIPFGSYHVYGYSFVPPTPFQLKDWERYDVSRYVDPGCVSPEEGRLTVPRDRVKSRYRTIREDLDELAGDESLERAVFLFHTPPSDTLLDRAALDGRTIDHVPLEVHVGSVAVRRFLEARQPLLSLHGHIHESARLTGAWRDALGRTAMFSAAHDGPELAVVRFDLEELDGATRILL